MFAIFSHYPTFLVFLAIVAAIVVTMVLMPIWIKFLKSSHIGQQVRADGPESHLVKQGTPTMGGVIMLVAVIATALVIGMPTPETFLLLGATVLTGLLGLVDDASKVVKERSLGLTPKAKLAGQFAIATGWPPRWRYPSCTRSTWGCSPRWCPWATASPSRGST